MTLLSQYSVILYSEQSIEELTHCVESEVLNASVVLFYDTTFELGDFFLSVLSYKHPLFANAPTIPLVYMLHDRKFEEIHTHFFTTLSNKFKCFNSELNIVTDREKSIVNSIRKARPLSRHYPCWNHIQRDVKFWLKKHKGTEDDIKTYTSHVWDLMDSNNELEFNEKFEKMNNHWTKEFKEYYKSYLKNDVLRTVKWKLVEQNIYIDRSGITTNAAESLNALIKRCTDDIGMSSQALVLSLFYLDMYYRKEILRGKCLQGTFILKPELLEFRLDAETIDWPAEHKNKFKRHSVRIYKERF
uniref:MULE transposase domain-containing protein n=1 Tax=Cacopsylla melanoneura TaxID=428564 RepID=A0A8D8WUU0_9HEMI